MENTGLVALLQQDKYEDLRRMYTLLRRVEGGLALIRSTMADHLKATGKQLVTVSLQWWGLIAGSGQGATARLLGWGSRPSAALQTQAT